MFRQSLVLILPCLLGVSWTCRGASPGFAPTTVAALKQMTLDELMSLQVTSVSRTAETFEDAAAAITVVTNEHVRRSGATSVPETMRWVPGLHVARRASSLWAVSARGFSSTNSEKLLVLSDTRSIYTPLYSGVFWDVQDYLMADIDRIEVIRGPGATLWGSNAVNGVINLTTKNAADTHGTYVETIVGTEERATFGARHGGRTSGGVDFRVFGKYSERDETFHDAESSDDWRLGHLGFRADWASGSDDSFTLQGDIYRGKVGLLRPSVIITTRPGPTGNLEASVAGGNILGRWTRSLGDGSEMVVRGYYDRTHRNDPSFRDDLDTVDLDVQHRFAPALDHELTWGLNYRFMSNRNVGKGVFALEPTVSRDHLFSSFVQDQVQLTDSAHITIGTKLEHNDFSGFEIQPGVRGAWNIAAGQTAWAAVSRAVRIPTRIERDIAIDVTVPGSDPAVRLLGNEGFGAEEMVAYEMGYRWRATPDLHLDVALFENRYESLASLEPGEPFVDPVDGSTVVPIVNENLTSGRARGVELMVTYTPFTWWRLFASYSYLDMNLTAAGMDLNRGVLYEGASPQHQFALMSLVTLARGIELDAQFRRVGALRSLPESVTGEGVPGYSELDLRISWRATEDLRLSLVGQNLLHDHHAEFGIAAGRGEIQRGAFARLEWGF